MRIFVLSWSLAIKAREKHFSRNEARRRLVAECVRLYGRRWVALHGAPLLSEKVL